MHSLKKAYNNFMTGKDAKNLEDTILKRLDQVEQLMDSNEKNEKNINRIFSNMKYTFQKVGLVKYDAFNEMGGKLSFSLALLSQTNDGFTSMQCIAVKDAIHTSKKLLMEIL